MVTKRRVVYTAATLLFCALLTCGAEVFTSYQAVPRRMTAYFERGDKVDIICDGMTEKCRLAVDVFGRVRNLSTKEISAIGKIVPDHIELVPLDDKTLEYGLNLHLICSEAITKKNAAYRCYANLTVRDSKVVSVSRIVIKEEYVTGLL